MYESGFDESPMDSSSRECALGILTQSWFCYGLVIFFLLVYTLNPMNLKEPYLESKFLTILLDSIKAMVSVSSASIDAFA